ncbi:Alpha/Beta hydrolase protein [Mycena sp. CBHHK59/15]|nr:Alpha/Beta hydrolase protein [Mycena sp. CBHHK59/15]
MDTVAQMKETEIQKILFPSYNLVTFCDRERRGMEKIGQFKLGHQVGVEVGCQIVLDAYYPSGSTGGKKHPILFFVYGGGFVTGERNLPAPVDLGYGNLGAFFAEQGFITLIPDYRLAPETTFPGPSEDLRDALAWAVANPDVLGPFADLASVFFLGHSAGAVHTATMLLLPSIAQDVHIKGAVLASTPFHFSPEGITIDSREPANMYFGSPEATAAHEPLALLRAAPTELLSTLPPLALLQAERDPAWFKVVAKDFDVAVDVKGITVTQIYAEGHNHISLTWALGTGAGEKWAEDMIVWMKGI